MKKIFCIIAVGMLTALSVGAVTNVTQAIESESLPADQFRPIINKAVFDLANTDIPALVDAANQAVTNRAPFVLGSTQLVFTATGVAAATNQAAVVSIPVRLNGTNYLLKLHAN